MTGRDEWVFDFSIDSLKKKTQFFIEEYNHEVQRWLKYKSTSKYKEIADESNPIVDQFLHERNIIKWSSRLKRDKLRKSKFGSFDDSKIRKCYYRPFVKQFLYYDYIPIDIKGQDELIFPFAETDNSAIWVKTGSAWEFLSLTVNAVTNYLPQGGSVCFALYRFDDQGNRIDNITDWALHQFRSHYFPGNSEVSGEMPPDADTKTITKLNIFHYVYAVLHHPVYREKYELNLKREFPRIPFYDDFWQWATWGKQLMHLHLTYETIAPFPLTRTDRDPDATRTAYKVRLKADKTNGVIELDTLTTLSGIPAAAWEYKLGNRSAIEWILDRYKERKPKDPTIREQFNTYRFADYKEAVVDLLGRVTAVSVETVNIIDEMPNA